jgi:hypothetical protein
VLERIDRSDMEFIEFVQREELRIESRAQNAGQAIFHELQQRQPYYISDARGKKRASVKHFHIAEAQRIVGAALQVKQLGQLVSPGTAKRVIIANHSEFEGVSQYPEMIQQMSSSAAQRMSKHPSKLKFVRAVVSCVKSALEKKINIIFVDSAHYSS